MAEVNANSLPAKTDLGTNDSAIVVDQTTNAGALVDLDVLADKVLDRITSKTFANQVGGSSAATLLAQLSTLNSNLNGTNITCTPADGFTLVMCSGGILSNLVYANMEFSGTVSTGTWTTLGTLPVAARPRSSVHTLVVSRSEGTPAGMARIENNGVVSIFTRTALNNTAFAFQFVYNKSTSR